MIGKLDPEENVMDESLFQSSRFTEDSLIRAYTDLGWDMRNDDIHVEIAGTQVYEIEGDGTRWKPVKGTRKYNKDAFIIIKNRSLNPTVSSEPNPDLKAHHLKTEKELQAELKKSDDEKGYDTYSK